MAPGKVKLKCSPPWATNWLWTFEIIQVRIFLVWKMHNLDEQDTILLHTMPTKQKPNPWNVPKAPKRAPGKAQD